MEVKRLTKVFINRDSFYDLLKENNLSIYQLSGKTGLAPSTIYRSIDPDNQKGVGGETIAKLSTGLGLNEAEFGKLFFYHSVLPKGNGKEASK